MQTEEQKTGEAWERGYTDGITTLKLLLFLPGFRYSKQSICCLYSC